MINSRVQSSPADCARNSVGLIALLLVLGCGGDSTSPTPAIGTKYTLTSSALSAIVGQSVVISAQLVDASDKPVAVSGRKITWTSSAAGTSNAGSFSAPTSTTNSNGIATVTYTLGTVARVPYEVKAVDDELPGVVSSTSVMGVTGPVAHYIILPAVLDPPAGALVIITIQAADGNGNPLKIANLLVTWTNTGSGGQWQTQSTIGYTGPDGWVSPGFWTAPTTGAAYTITATDDNGASGRSPTFTTQSHVALASLANGVGGLSTCGIATDGAAWCWGANESGQVGNGTTVDRSLAGKVNGNLKFAYLSAALRHTCGLTTAGAVQCWGSNFNGQLGDNTTVAHTTPGPIVSAVAFTAVTAGYDHTCALASGGDAYCWGSNFDGQLGTGTQTQLSSIPVRVSGGLSFASISAGSAHTCGVTTGGDAYCWGSNQFGQLGDNTMTDRRAPVAVQGGLKLTAISLGALHSCGLVTGGAAHCWGQNLGTGTNDAAPKLVGGGLSFATISAGGLHTCGVTTSSTAWCWGGNFTGVFGDNSLTSSASPVQVQMPGGQSLKSISAGGQYGDAHTCGLTTTGYTYCWGSNDRGQLGVGLLFPRYSSPLRIYGQP